MKIKEKRRKTEKIKSKLKNFQKVLDKAIIIW